MKIIERYNSATRSSNLRSKAETTLSDTDVLGAFGIASKEHQLGVALHRLFTGDERAARVVVDVLAEMARGKFHDLRRVQAEHIARSVLAWNRAKTCPVCAGKRFDIIPGTPTLSTKACKPCKGTGTILLHSIFTAAQWPAAQWMQVQIEAQAAVAGQAAMKALAPSLDL